MNNLAFDRARFPMVWVESLNAYIHWLPVTKIQFEYFLWDFGGARLDQEWLDRIYQLNPRVSPGGITKGNYWRAFMTGAGPGEAQLFADWCGGLDKARYALPTAEEWQKAYKEMQGRTDFPVDPKTMGAFPERIKTLLSKIVQARPEPKFLADQMLFDGGVLEWVVNSGKSQIPSDYVAYGQTSRSWEKGYSGLYLSRPFPVSSVPKGPEDNSGRASYYGFRLLRRET